MGIFFKFLSLFIFLYINSFSNNFFPKPKLTLLTPSISNNHFTTQREMLDYLGEIHKNSIHTKVELLGPTKNNNFLPLFLIGKNKDFLDNKPTVMLIGQQHGDEPMSCDVLMGTIKRIANGDLTYLLERLNFIILPRANPDGAMAFTRTNRDKIDINRDHTVLSTREGKLISEIYNKYSPHIFIDIHEYVADGHSYSKILKEETIPYYDLLYLIPTNPNYSLDLGLYAFKEVLRPLQKNMKQNGFSSHYYYSPFTPPQHEHDILKLYTGDSTPKIARNSYGLKGSLSFLIELRGKNIGRENIERRLESGLKSLELLFKTFYKDKDKILSLIQKNLFKEKEIYYTNWEFRPLEDTLVLIRVKTNELYRVPVLKYTLHTPKILNKRKNPMAYIIDGKEISLIGLLQKHNISSLIVQRDITLSVEKFKPRGNKYILIKEKKLIKKGTFIVPFENNFLSALLDPESRDSLTHLNIIDYKNIYRYTGD